MFVFVTGFLRVALAVLEEFTPETKMALNSGLQSLPPESWELRRVPIQASLNQETLKETVLCVT